MDDEKQSMRAWFGFAEPFDWRKRSYLGPFLSVVGILIVGGLFSLAIAAAFKLLGSAVFGNFPQGAGSSFGLTGIIVAMIGAPFVIWRAVVAQKQVNVAEQGQITDRLNKAVEGLGAEKTVKDEYGESTKPNLEVRIGAIYALERIAQDSLRDHIQVMETLCAYVRNNVISDNIGTRVDVQTALLVLDRRSKKALAHERDRGYYLDLAECSFHTLTLSDSMFQNSRLDGTMWTNCSFQSTSFSGADMTNCQFSECIIQNSHFKDAVMSGVKFSHSTIEGNRFDQAKLNGAQFLHCQLFKNSFVEADVRNSFFDDSNASGDNFKYSDCQYVHLKGTRFFQANFQGLQIRSLKLEGVSEFERCNFFGAALRKVDLSKYNGGEEDFDGVFLFNCKGTSSELPDSKDEPDFDSQPDFFQGWRAHQLSIGYQPSNPT